MNLQNITLIVTGVASGIGAELARLARFQGATVIGVDRHAPQLTLDSFVQADLGDPASIDALVSLTGFSLVAAVVVVIILLRIGRRITGTTIALALILGGTIGNVWDRLRFGLVTDFLEVHIVHYHWPDFNVADSAVVVGACLLLLEIFRPQHTQSIETA